MTVHPQDVESWQQWWTLMKGPASLVMNAGEVEKVVTAAPNYDQVTKQLHSLVNATLIGERIFLALPGERAEHEDARANRRSNESVPGGRHHGCEDAGPWRKDIDSALRLWPDDDGAAEDQEQVLRAGPGDGGDFLARGSTRIHPI